MAEISAKVVYNKDKKAWLAMFYIGDELYVDPRLDAPGFFCFDDAKGALELMESIKRNQEVENGKR